jgi:D-ribulokinase
MADTTGLTIAIPQTPEPVLLGAAMLGAVAAKSRASIGEAMASMSAVGRLSEPTAPAMADFHRSKRKVHALMRTFDRDSRDTMQDSHGPGAASIAGL